LFEVVLAPKVSNDDEVSSKPEGIESREVGLLLAEIVVRMQVALKDTAWFSCFPYP